VKVLDFGVAKLLPENDAGSTGATQTGQILGTPRYMAPEQASGGKKISPAADRFALGLIAFRLLSRRHYFEGDNWVTLMQTVTRGPTASPSEMGCARGTGFDQWFARACAFEPGERFGSCAEQVDALAGALAGGSLAGRTTPWRRRRALIGLGAVAGAVGVATVAWNSGRRRTAQPPAAGPETIPASAAPTVTAPQAVLPPPVAAPPDAGAAPQPRAAVVEPPPPRHRPPRHVKLGADPTAAETAKPQPAPPEPTKAQTATPEPKKNTIWEEP
jgi:serine/threonine-protein kinase